MTATLQNDSRLLEVHTVQIPGGFVKPEPGITPALRRDAGDGVAEIGQPPRIVEAVVAVLEDDVVESHSVPVTLCFKLDVTGTAKRTLL